MLFLNTFLAQVRLAYDFKCFFESKTILSAFTSILSKSTGLLSAVSSDVDLFKYENMLIISHKWWHFLLHF